MKNLNTQLYKELTSLSETIPSGFKALYAKTLGFFLKNSDGTEARLLTTTDTTHFGTFPSTNGTSGQGLLSDGAGGTYWASIGSGGTYLPVIVSDYLTLKGLKDTSTLVPFQWYQFAFQTIHCIPYTTEQIHTGDTENLLIQAATVNTFFGEVKSIEHPDDYIIYNFDLTVCEDLITSRYGYITLRIDEFRNKVTFDHRNVNFRRYKFEQKSTTFNGTNVLTDAYNATIDYDLGATIIYDSDVYVCISHVSFGSGIEPGDTYADTKWLKLFNVDDYVCLDNGITPLYVSVYDSSAPDTPAQICFYGEHQNYGATSLPSVPINKIWQYTSGSIYVGTQGNGVYVSTDNCITWTQLATNLLGSSLNVLDFALHNDGSGNLSIIIATEVGTFINTYPINGHTDWTSWGGSSLSGMYTTQITNTSFQTYYVSTYNGLLKTTNDGVSWTNISTGLTDNPAGNKTGKFTINGSYILIVLHYYGTDTLYHTNNNGSTWTQSGTYTLSFDTIHDLFIQDSVYILCYNNGIAVSTDNGVNWSSENINLQGNISCHAKLDTRYGDFLNYIPHQGLIFGTSAQSTNQLLLTYNNGITSSIILLPPSNVNILSLYYISSTELLIGTSSGLFIYDLTLDTGLYHDYKLLQNGTGDIDSTIKDNTFLFTTQSLSSINSIFISATGNNIIGIKNITINNAIISNNKLVDCNIYDIQLDGINSYFTNVLFYNFNAYMISGTFAIDTCYGYFNGTTWVNIKDRIMITNSLFNNGNLSDLHGNGIITGIITDGSGIRECTLLNCIINVAIYPFPASAFMQNNNFLDGNNEPIDYSSATHVFNSYYCEILTNSDNILVLRYLDSDNVQQYVDPTT